MKNIILTLLSAATAFTLNAQCEFIELSVSSSSETQVQLYVPSPFFVPNPDSNEHFWNIMDTDGNIIVQETTDSDGFFSFSIILFPLLIP